MMELKWTNKALSDLARLHEFMCPLSKPGNLSRTLKTMSNYGIVEMRREKNHVRPIAKATDFHIVTA